jgi:RNA polymerase sigma factor (sigma-70 family)
MTNRVPTQQEFESLLSWLDPDPERAGEKYETIRRALIKIFTARQCLDAEDLADETINRVTSRLAEIRESYVGDPALYFYRVARLILLEKKHGSQAAPPSLPPESLEDPQDVEHRYTCLEKCMAELEPQSRELIQQYYLQDRSLKIYTRVRLANQMSLKPHVLRVRVHRIREKLRKCVEECLRVGEDE